MFEKLKISYEPPARDDQRAPPYTFFVDRLFDAVKLVGTANSSGLFGTGVAIYYFGTRSHEILLFIKLATAIYFAGVFLFAFSYQLCHVLCIPRTLSLGEHRLQT